MGGRIVICLVDVSNHVLQINRGDPLSMTYGAKTVIPLDRLPNTKDQLIQSK